MIFISFCSDRKEISKNKQIFRCFRRIHRKDFDFDFGSPADDEAGHVNIVLVILTPDKTVLTFQREFFRRAERREFQAAGIKMHEMMGFKVC